MRFMRVVSAGAFALVLGCSGTDTPIEYPDAVTADPNHYSVEFENAAARLIRITYGPGDGGAADRRGDGELHRRRGPSADQRR